MSQSSARSRPVAVPEGLPRLARGRHAGPQDGACVMELTSILAGECFSDHPRCTHPVLAAVARAVNDTVSDSRRDTLTRFVPDLIGTATVGFPGDASVVAAVADRALRVEPKSRLARRTAARAARQLRRQRDPRVALRIVAALTRRHYRLRAVCDATALVVEVLAPHGDDALCDTFAAAVRESRELLAGVERPLLGSLSC